jgi:23S rRNA (guanosine2251-2'-O)-methyltransferase
MFPVVNLSSTVELLKKHNYWIYASALQDKTIDYAKIKYDKKTVLIVGSEQSGISQLLLKNSDFIIKIPMFGTVQSLNASVSTGIMVAEIVKQLK